MTDRLHLRVLHINGAEIHYVEEGEGDPLVFVHGGLSDYRTWRPQVQTFSERYRVISYSRRAHYPNAWPPDYTNCTMAVHADDLAGLIEALGLGRAHIVANSYGGYISLYMALRRPEMVRTLVLAEPPVYPILERLPGGRELTEEFITRAWVPAGEAFRKGDPGEGVKLFLDGAVGKHAWEGMHPRARAAMMKNAPELAVSAMSDPETHMPDMTCEELGRIEAPTLLLRGENSPRMYYLVNDELARCIPNSEQALIHHAAHVLNADNPEEHDRIVLDFLARH